MSNDELRIPGLTEGDADLVNRLWQRLRDKQRRNALRSTYYDGKNAVKQFGLAMPAQFGTVDYPLGWPAKAVDTLNNRCHLDGFVMPGDDDDALGIDEIWTDNHLGTQAPQAGLSSLIHAVSWIITTRGAAGEPKALITPKDALSGTGEWNQRTYRLNNFLSLLEVDADDEALGIALYLPGRIVTAERESVRTAWTVDDRKSTIDYVPVEPLVYKPRLGRPFGSSRISRPVMAYTNMAMRTILRSEVTAELYSVPQRALLGADESMFGGDPAAVLGLVYGKLVGIPKDEDGDVPEFKQFAQATQEPHMAQLRTLASMFAGETSIPVTELGIHSDANPASADAVYAHQGSLIATAEMTTDGWRPAYQRAMLTALKITQDEKTIPDEWQKLRARFRNPAHESRASATDAGLKMVQAFPWLAETDVGLELFGLDEVMLDRLKADRRKLSARSTATALAALAGDAVE